MSEVYYNRINAEEEGQRLDNYLIRQLKGVPRSHIYRIIRSGEVRVNKKRASVSLRLMYGDSVRIPPVRIAAEHVVYVGEKLERKLKECILYEDAGLLVMNKPAGIAVHGGSEINLGIIEALRKIRVDLAYLELVHRLDRGTSGCLLIAKKRSVLRSLQALLVAREVKKTYWALLAPRWEGAKRQCVEAPLKKNILKSGERIVSVNSTGKPSQTVFKLLENYEQSCWVEISPTTGRTHQIRVHSAYLGHAVVGDEKYAKPESMRELYVDITRLYLHARAIQFNLHGVLHQYEAPIDASFEQTLKQLRTRSLSKHE